MIDYTSKMRHLSETMLWREYNQLLAKKNSVYIEKGRIVYYYAMSDDYFDEFQLTEASKIKVPNMSPLEQFLVWLIKGKGVIKFDNSFIVGFPYYSNPISP